MIAIRRITVEDAGPLAALIRESWAHLEPWEPARDESFFTEAGQRRLIADTLDQDNQLPHVIVEDGRIVGRLNLANVVRGPFLSANLGYWVGAQAAGRGIATAAVAAVARAAFTQYGLHRIEAATLLHNVRSQRVLANNGFERIGMAPRYLRIAGEWQDHYLFQLLAENWLAAHQGDV